MGYAPGKYTKYKSIFRVYPDNAQKPNYNKHYSTCFIPLQTIAALWNMTSDEANKILQKHKVYASWYCKHNGTYLVGAVDKIAKKEGINFVIPIGLFDKGDIVYVGHEFSVMENIWHPEKIRRFMSLLEMYTQMGLPVKNVYIAPTVIPKLEDDFLYAECKLLSKFNKASEKKRHLVLCTKMGKREEAEKIVEKYNKQFPGTMSMIDFDHLIHLRKLAHKKYLKKNNV